MTVDDVKALPMVQKIQIMEALWEDFRERLEASDVPEDLKNLLDQRRKRVQEGSAHLVDWDQAKSGLGRS
jgi:hypothetical protein